MPLHPPLHALRARAHPPLSSANLSRRRPPQCPFHTFPPLRADDANDRRTHYEVLDIPPNAPPKVIKKYHHTPFPPNFLPLSLHLAHA